MIATKSTNSNVVKGKLIVDVDNLSVGDEIHISGEKFNVISETDGSVTMLAKYNLGTDYRQNTIVNSVAFADDIGWEYAPGPKEIDIQVWSTNPKIYVSNYVSYLQTELGDNSVSGDLITLKELGSLGCIVPTDYTTGADPWNDPWTCVNSSQKDWLINGQFWWIRSAHSVYSHHVWIMDIYGGLFGNAYHSPMPVRPIIIISKESLKNYLKT